MFDLSFSELMIIAIVALLVIGPEKLPKLARTAGAFIGRLQRYMGDVKDEINRESRFEELKALQEEILEGTQSAEADVRSSVDSILASADATYKPAQPNPKKPRRKAATKKSVVKKAATKRTATKKTTAKKKPIAKKSTTTKSPAAKKPKSSA